MAANQERALYTYIGHKNLREGVSEPRRMHKICIYAYDKDLSHHPRITCSAPEF
jgi:hypothetical protein